MTKIFLDTETIGFTGPIILIQYAEGETGEVKLHEVWTKPIKETLELIHWFMENELCGFNMSFDHFQLCKLYTILSLFPDKDAYPEDHINTIAELEPFGRDGPCLKPKSALDLMLYARKGPYQSTMARSDIRIKRVPTQLAWELAKELEKRIPLREIYFAKRKDKLASNWQVEDIEDADGDIDVDFKDIVLKFRPSSALKALAVDALGIDESKILRYGDVSVKLRPVEIEYAPFALAVGNPTNWKGAWPEIIKYHISHWQYHKGARQYAELDVIYLQQLYQKFGRPEFGDDDSTLACAVGAVRWRGFKIDIKGVEELKNKVEKSLWDGKFRIPTAPHTARYYIQEVMSDDEKAILQGSTKKILLLEIAKWQKEGMERHPAAERAEKVLQARLSQYEINFLNKLLLAGRFHVDANVIGTLSSRMSGSTSSSAEAGGEGSTGINAQGVKKEKEIRNKFPLAWPGYILSGGDFSAFEVTIAEASYKDPNLHKQLLTCEKCENELRWDGEDFRCIKCRSNKGKKIHALFGMSVYPGYTYEGIKATEGTADDKYTKAKSSVFTMIYGGTEHSMANRLGIAIEDGLKGLKRFHTQFPGVALAQKTIIDQFSALRQPGGIGSKVDWHEPAEYIESMLGFRRYFTLENQICKALYTLANNPPKEWRTIQLKVRRRERLQTVGGALQSALFAAAFALQAFNTRAAINHVIQSTGAQITKAVQRQIWDIQPSGINEWLVQPMNIHDEIMCPTKQEIAEMVKQHVMQTVESFRNVIPLIKMDWIIGLKTWAEKS